MGWRGIRVDKGGARKVKEGRTGWAEKRKKGRIGGEGIGWVKWVEGLG